MTDNHDSQKGFSSQGPPRKPLALSNWKMTMTMAESLRWVNEFHALAEGLLQEVEVVVCPPFTALWAVKDSLKGTAIQLGGQNISAWTEIARTGEISAQLLVDVGCQWVMLGHWEARRYSGDDDHSVNRKVHIALEAGLRPILLVGEGRDEECSSKQLLEERLERLLAGCRGEQAARMVFTYEPEIAIGAEEPAVGERVARGCGTIRRWLNQNWGEAVGEKARIIYGGSVSPERASELLSIPDMDGLGASREGRDPQAFYKIVRQIASTRGNA
jgi:triosephosphate isomerase